MHKEYPLTSVKPGSLLSVLQTYGLYRIRFLHYIGCT